MERRYVFLPFQVIHGGRGGLWFIIAGVLVYIIADV